MNERLVTIKQAEKLANLGFNMPVCHMCIRNTNLISPCYPTDWNHKKETNFINTKHNGYPYLSVPTVFETLEWLYTFKSYKRVIGLELSSIVGIKTKRKVYSELRKIITSLIESIEKDNGKNK